MSQIVTVSPKGQITIPKSVRDKLPSTKMLLEKQGAGFVLKPVKIEAIEDDLKDFHALAETSFDFWNSQEDVAAEKSWTNCKPL